MPKNGTAELLALKVKQWIQDWEKVKFDTKSHRRKPQPWFYQFSIPASHLKALSGIYPRTTKERQRGVEDLGIQRRHEADRSAAIHQFIRFGYPWSELTERKRASGEYDDLRKPGWLPTAIVVNILGAGDERFGRQVDRNDLVTIRAEGDEQAYIQLPKGFTGAKWRPGTIPPVEVIDGQHRLWAFGEGETYKGDFELPVVAFHQLDLSWQAYLFYSINIKPKKINASLAFDLYPLLRTEDWLEKFEGHVIYRETRAQELVDLLWSHADSPWNKHINMLGETGLKGTMVTQAAWIRSLLATYIRSWESPRSRIGGLFGAPVGSHKQTLPWSRAEQAAFIMTVGNLLEKSVVESKDDWAKKLRAIKPKNESDRVKDAAFSGPYTLMNQDQGIRAILHVSNDLCYLRADKLKLDKWGKGSNVDGKDASQVTNALQSLKKEPVYKFLEEITEGLATYDWRTSGTPGLSQQESLMKAAFRGAGGYKDLRHQVLLHLAKGSSEVAKAAKDVVASLGLK